MTKAQQMLEFIEKGLAAGLAIHVCTCLKIIAVTPKTAAKFKAGGYQLFKIDSEGNLRIASGNKFNIICTKDISLVIVKAVK